MRQLGWVAGAVVVMAGMFIALLIKSRGGTELDERAVAAPPPREISCKVAAENHRTYAPNQSVELVEELQRVTERICVQDQWPSGVRRCLFAGTTYADAGVCMYALDSVQASTYRRAIEGAVAVDRARPQHLSPSCDRYRAAIDRMSSCPGIPQQTRDALQQAFDQTTEGWARLPAAGRHTLDDVCLQATLALDEALTSVCP